MRRSLFMRDVFRSDEIKKAEENCNDAYLIKGEEHMGMFEMEEAERCMKKHLLLNPSSHRAHKNLMDIYYETGDFENSLQHCNKLLEEDTANPDLYYKKGYLLDCLNDVDAALECYDRALALKPDYYEVICDKGKLLGECDCSDESLEAYLHAIEVDPTQGEAYMGAAFAYDKLGDKKRAIEFSNKACELEPEDDFFACHNYAMKKML
jgi:tetratricopeptide (TPR) repeat protein